MLTSCLLTLRMWSLILLLISFQHVACNQPMLYSMVPTEIGEADKLVGNLGKEQNIDRYVGIAMHNVLQERGEFGYYTSDVMVACDPCCRDKKKWVIKSPKLPLTKSVQYDDVDFRALLGASLFYKIAAKLGCCDLVPKTELTLIRIDEHLRLAIKQDYVEDVKPRAKVNYMMAGHMRRGYDSETGMSLQEYDSLQCRDNTGDIDTQRLKILLFTLGQWDLRQGNVLVQNDGRPVAVDNERILDLDTQVARVDDYGELKTKKVFTKVGEVRHGVHDCGSQDQPQVLHGTAYAVDKSWQGLLGINEPLDVVRKALENVNRHLASPEDVQLTRKNSVLVCDDGSLLNDCRFAINMVGSLEDFIKENTEVAGQGKTKTIYYYIKCGALYRNFPMEMSVYLDQCHEAALAQFDKLSSDLISEAFQESLDELETLLNPLEGRPLSYMETPKERKKQHTAHCTTHIAPIENVDAIMEVFRPLINPYDPGYAFTESDPRTYIREMVLEPLKLLEAHLMGVPDQPLNSDQALYTVNYTGQYIAPIEHVDAIIERLQALEGPYMKRVMQRKESVYKHFTK
jgi:hypothetical protein